MRRESTRFARVPRQKFKESTDLGVEAGLIEPFGSLRQSVDRTDFNERGFSKKVGLEKFPKRLLYFGSQDILREMREASDPEQIAEKTLALFDRDGRNWKERGPLSQAISWEVFESGFASPKIKNIAKFVGRVGYADFKRDLARKQAGRHVFVTNAIDHLVDVRNAIAHGDLTRKRHRASSQISAIYQGVLPQRRQDIRRLVQI